MRVVAAQHREQLAELRQQLDPGEAEAIIVAVELRASLILIDEQRGRRIAADRGFKIYGLAGRFVGSKGAPSHFRVQAHT
jgi:predicted nucleic acid-binding protein